MAKISTFCRSFSLLFVCAVLCVNLTAAEVRLPPPALVNIWSELISSELTTKLDAVSGASEVKKLYEERGFAPVHINGSDLVTKVANNWQVMLRDKMVAVDNIVKRLEQDFAKYTFNTTIDQSDVEYFNAKNMTNIDLTYLDNFKSKVNTSYSSVQIPTDIWVGDRTILNGINATNGIDEVFRENYKKDPQLLWQYFGSADGFYRSYPAASWITRDVGKDQYDVRRRGWYIQAASSPKNVMILVDTSGSTNGLTLEITKVSVSKALDTLGNDDFVNVAWFNSSVGFVVKCFEKFVQANLRNKNHIKEQLKWLDASGVADFKKALTLTFNEFKKFEEGEEKGEENQGAKCHRVILIFTDGGETDEQDTFEMFNDPVRTRVFVFKVGTDSMVPADGVREMACNNKGYFSNIQSFGAVRLTTLDYVPVLSRPMVLSGKKHFMWSDIYLDVLGLGMMTTLTRPVYNISGENNQQMLAVVGTDITTKNMEDTVPQRKDTHGALHIITLVIGHKSSLKEPQVESKYKQSIGPEGYAFGINSNGYILLHPRLKAQEEIEAILELGYLTEPPNVDFLEVEYESPEKIKLRRNMIDQKTGQEPMQTPIMSRDERFLEFVNMTYSYTFIANTTFSVAIAQPDFGLWELAITSSEPDVKAFVYISKQQGDSYFMIAPWVFCDNLVGMEGKVSTENITKSIQQTLKESDDGNETLVKCDDKMVRNLLVDAEITERVAEYWKNQRGQNPGNFTGVVFNLVATHGGITRIYPRSVPQSWSDSEREAFQDPWEQLYYERSLYTTNYVFAAPYSTGWKPLPVNETYLTPILVSKAVRMQKKIMHAVVAVSLDPGVFNEMWIGKTKQGFSSMNSSALSCANESIHCYILDDGGFIIATNQDNKQDTVGSFFGLIDGDLMLDLKNKSVYNLLKMNDFQAACPRQPIETGAAGLRSIHVPTISDVINFNTWAATAAWSFLRHFLFDVIFLGFSDMKSNYVDAEEVKTSENVSCIKVLKQYYYGEEKNANGNIPCTECQRLWRTSRIEGTNLLLVVTEHGCSNCPNRLVMQAPAEPTPGGGYFDLTSEYRQKYKYLDLLEVPDPCKTNLMPRYRKRPAEHCYDFHPNESYVDCSLASAVTSHLPIIIAVQLIIFAVLN